jgi:hypothetical protein
MATFNATTGIDTFHGTIAADTIVVTDTNQVQSGDTFDGGGGTDTLQIGATGNSGGTIDFSAAATNGVRGFLNISRLTFTNSSGSSTAQFIDSQFGVGKLGIAEAVMGTGALNNITITMPGPATFSMAFWTFANWTSGTDQLLVVGSSGGDTIRGSSQIDGGSGADTIIGNGGADIMTGGDGKDRFMFAAGDNALTIGGSGTSGTISGFDTITDFSAGQTTVGSEILGFTSAAVVADTDGTDGIDSGLLLHTGAVVGSHAIHYGIITFDDTSTFGTPVPLTSLSDVAAVVQYLQANDLGNAGATVAFTATIAGQAETFVYFHGAATPGATNVLVDLNNVSATGIAASGGKVRVALNLPDVSIDPLVDATEVTAVACSMSALLLGSTAVVTFTDTNGATVQATRTTNGAFTVDLSSLAEGQITVSLQVTDLLSNTMTEQLPRPGRIPIRRSSWRRRNTWCGTHRNSPTTPT